MNGLNGILYGKWLGKCYWDIIVVLCDSVDIIIFYYNTESPSFTAFKCGGSSKLFVVLYGDYVMFWIPWQKIFSVIPYIWSTLPKIGWQLLFLITHLIELCPAYCWDPKIIQALRDDNDLGRNFDLYFHDIRNSGKI